MEDDLKKFWLEDDLKFFESSFEVSLGCFANVRKEVNSNSCYFTTIPGGGRVGSGWLEELKIRLTQLRLANLFELSLAIQLTSHSIQSSYAMLNDYGVVLNSPD